ncbi:MAG: TatD family hydrolase [Tepidisphaeraceae bacterium]|jgi:TatD DNase family protein
MIDTHCHLSDPRLAGQLEGVLSRAAAAGVLRMVTIGTKPSDWEAALAITKSHSNVRCALGVHPNHCHEVDVAQMAVLRQLQGEAGVVAVGETGLDYHHEFAARRLQVDFFELHLQMAADLNRGVVIHCREAVEDCLAILAAQPKVRAVFHCFTGTEAEAHRILEAGYLLGFTGVLTFKNAEGLRQAAKEAPGDRILVETDAPYLSPEPMRKQKTNEPAWVMHTAAALAGVRGVELAEIDRMTTENAKKFYGWD